MFDEMNNLESKEFQQLAKTTIESIATNKQKFIDSLDLNEPRRLAVIKSLFFEYSYIDSIEQNNLDIDDKFVDLLISLLTKLRDHLDEIYNFNDDADKFKLFCRLIATEIFYKINLISFESLTFNTKFQKKKGLQVLFDCLNNQTLLNSYSNLNGDQASLNACDEILRRNIGILACMGKHFGHFKTEWKECHAVKSLLNYFEKTKDIKDNKIYACMTIALVAADDEIDSIPEIQTCLPDIIAMIEACSIAISTGDNLERAETEFEDDDGTKLFQESCYLNVDDTEWSLLNLLDALYHIAVNDKIKYDIYSKFKVGQYLTSIIFYGNHIEQEYALNALWQLCYHAEVADHVRTNCLNLYEFVETLSTQTENKKVAQKASGIIWLLTKKTSTTATTKSSLGKLGLKATLQRIMPSIHMQHIMISYNRATRDACLSLKIELKKWNFKVWIDVESISGT